MGGKLWMFGCKNYVFFLLLWINQVENVGKKW